MLVIKLYAGFKINGSGLIDQLTYTYQPNSNKLSIVNDAVNNPLSKLGDFHYTGTKQATDYNYDGNGNLILDNNKAISSIVYNYLNLPQTLTVTAKGTISYTYDAGGNKLLKTTVDNTTTPSKTTTTLYLGGIVYQNDTLQFIGQEEGRARWALHHYINGSTSYGFEYDYFLKDHLGNTRMVLTQEKDTSQYIATMEAAYRATENQLFYNIPQTSYPRASVVGYPTDNTTVPNDSLARVNGNGPKTGPAILLKVMSGDVVDIAIKSFYKSGGTVNSPNSTLTDIVNSLASGLVTATSGSHGAITDFTNTSSPLYAAVNNFLPSNDPNTTSKPKAYLNWILLDDQFKGVSTYPQSGAIVVGSADVLNTLAYSGIPITKNGYLYIWVSNETPGWDVFFDNLSIKKYSGPITEETHYYPFGLRQEGICSKAAGTLQNKDKTFQGQKFDDDLGINYYSFKWRNHDPQIGRFIEIDPLSEDYEYNSPYAFSENKVTGHVELEGLEAVEVAKLIYNNVADGLYSVGKWINDNLNPAVPAAELITGKSNESNFTEPKPRLQSATELGISLIPGGKVEGAAVKAIDKTIVKIEEKQLIKAEERAAKLSEKPRPGQDFTKAGKEATKDVNRVKNGGKMQCEGCGQEVQNAQKHTKGNTPPSNESHVDHVDPKSNGGSGTPNNGQVLCRGCNLDKSNKPPEQ